MNRPLLRTAAVVVLILAVLVLPGVLSVASPATAPTPLAGTTPSASGVGSSAAVTGGARTEGPAANCTQLSDGWAAVGAYDSAPAVAASLQSPCFVSHDAPALYFVSNASRSASEVQFAVALPPNGTSPASSLSGFWMGMWVSGVDCSYGGASYLTVELLPPYDREAGVPPSPFWTVRAPLWDLVPAGSCDSQCQNDTAFFTISYQGYCEDDAVTVGMGSLTDFAGQFRPGDLLTVDITGAPGGARPVEVLVNDSTDPALDITWNYSSPSVIAGVGPILPFYSAATSTSGGWNGGLDVGFGWQNCPLPTNGSSFSSACNSYDGPVANVSGAPQLDGVTSWNATTHGYSNRYASVATVSSSGACSGLADVAPCADFTSYGGTGSYPTFGVESQGGRAWFADGPAASDERTAFGGGATEFPANGNLSSLHDPTTITSITPTVAPNAVEFAVRVTDPNGVSSVTVGSWWCTRNSTRSSLSYPAVLSTAPINTTYDGNWTVTVPTGAAGMIGSFYYSVRARSASGAFTSPVTGEITLSSGTGGSCGASDPPPPGFSAADVFPIGGGYALNWNESSGAGVANFTVQAHPAAGGATLTFYEGNVTNARIGGLTGNVSYVLSVIATNPAGLLARSPLVSAVNTYYPLVALAPQVSASSGWVNQTTVRVSANATGGFPRFSFDISFGDGTQTVVNTTSDQASAVHFYGDNYTGDARVSVALSDSIGDSAAAPPAFVPIRGTPLGPVASIAGGNGFVHLAWSPPAVSPVNSSAFAVTAYTVYWTTDPASAPYLTAAWPTNALVPNVGAVGLLPSQTVAAITVPDGTRVYAQVVAWDKYGESLLAPESGPGREPVLSATAGAFAAGPIATSPGAGGPAPFAENFSTEVTTGEGTALVNATYRFSGGASAPATIGGGSGTFWANASYTFDRPGPVDVFLYALDSIGEFTIASTSILVTPGPAPLVAVTVAPTPVWVNSSVGFTATASGGSGQYNFSWALGDRASAQGPQTTYSYTNATTYIVTVTATDALWGGVTVATVPVSVLPLPSVAIALTANGGAGTYRLSAIVSGGVGNFSYTWVFDDGTQGVGPVVSHTWAPGTYTVSLVATDGYGHSVTATTIVVVGSGSSGGSGASGTVPLVDAYLLLGTIALLAVVVVLLFFRSRRPPPASTAEPMYGEAGGPGTDAAPVSDYAEESPPGT